MQTLQPCPLPNPGIYHLTGATGGCVYRLDIGCRNSSVVHVESAAVCSNTHSPAFSSPREFYLHPVSSQNYTNEAFICRRSCRPAGGIVPFAVPQSSYCSLLLSGNWSLVHDMGALQRGPGGQCIWPHQ